jgi:hypothetical protein
MASKQFVTVYLDSQDYSRFGDVIRGKSSADAEQAFENLKALKSSGAARFVYSMPILSELLQYHPDHEETSFAKAKAIEELCGDSALMWPPRLIEGEAAALASQIGLLPEGPKLECVRANNEWFPRITGELTNLRESLRNQFDAAVASFGSLNRAQRRMLEKQKTDQNLFNAVKSATPLIADKYGIPESAVHRSVLALMRDRCTPDEASHLLFGAIAKPTAFVNAYFKVQQGDKSLPQWMSSLGESLQRNLLEFRQKVEEIASEPEHIAHLRSVLREDIHRFGAALLRLIDTEEAEQGVTKPVLDALLAQPDRILQMPSCQIVAEAMLGYIEQTVAISGTPAKVERSFGGDVIHSLYIDYVDIWRGDRRFSALLRERLPSRRHKIQASLSNLPEQIRKLVESDT